MTDLLIALTYVLQAIGYVGIVIGLLLLVTTSPKRQP